jgi:hypothetical protein
MKRSAGIVQNKTSSIASRVEEVVGLKDDNIRSFLHLLQLTQIKGIVFLY